MSDLDITQLKANLEKEIEQRQTQLKKLTSAPELSAPQKLAVHIHKCLCRQDHNDNCAWYYAIKDYQHDWKEYTHNKYLKIAQKLMFEYSRGSSTGYRRGDEDRLIRYIDILAERD